MASVTLLLCGDVMTGRGVDQILPHPSDPVLHESVVRSAVEYVELAERTNGPISRPVSYSYVWGDALAAMDAAGPAVRIANLETSVTVSGDWIHKGINYRMHPDNVACLSAARLDCCTLANNHVLDWDVHGLEETLSVLHRAGIRTAGAGHTLREAQAPAVIAAGDSARVLVLAAGTTDSGIPQNWAAQAHRPGVHWLPTLSRDTAGRIGAQIHPWRRPNDLVVLSIHWGDNWGYPVPGEHRRFAHDLIDLAGVDVIHGHSSHHPKGIEIYKGRPILYGCGDFLNDYEGIWGYQEFRSHLTALYSVVMDPLTHRLVGLELTPFAIRKFRLQRASEEEAGWLCDVLDRESRKLGAGVTMSAYGRLLVSL